MKYWNMLTDEGKAAVSIILLILEVFLLWG